MMSESGPSSMVRVLYRIRRSCPPRSRCSPTSTRNPSAARSSLSACTASACVDRRSVAGRHHEVIRARLAAVDPRPVLLLPCGSDRRECRVHRHRPGILRFRALDTARLRAVGERHVDARERLGRVVERSPGQRRDLDVTHTGDGLVGVLHPAPDGDHGVGDRALDLVHGDGRLGAPARILVALLRELAWFELARVRLDHLVDDRRLEHRAERAVDRDDRAGHQLAGGPERTTSRAWCGRTSVSSSWPISGNA